MSAPYKNGYIQFKRGINNSDPLVLKDDSVDANEFDDIIRSSPVSAWVDDCGTIIVNGESYDHELEKFIEKLAEACRKKNYGMSGVINEEDDPDNIMYIEDNGYEWLTRTEYGIKSAGDDDLITELSRRGYNVTPREEAV